MKNPSHETMVSNIRHCYNRASLLDKSLGDGWYEQAHAEAQRLSEQYSISTAQAAGVIAALSPLTPWPRNLELAVIACDLHPAGFLPSSMPTLTGSAVKAWRILSGEDPWAVLTSQKVRAFFEGILYNGETDTVCVDRHALSIAHGMTIVKADQKMTPRQYAQIVAAYVEVAIQAGIPAAKLQAITWVAWRRQRGIED